MKLTPSFFVQQPILSPSPPAGYQSLLSFCRHIPACGQPLFCRRQRIHLPGELALQVCRFVLVDHALFSEFIDHGSNFRQLFASFPMLFYGTEVTNRIPRGFPVIFIAIAALFGLPYILLGCAMISHELDNFRTAKVRPFTRTTKSTAANSPKSLAGKPAVSRAPALALQPSPGRCSGLIAANSPQLHSILLLPLCS